MRYDAIVIGAGVNGLAAAVHLAAKGWKVAVLERAPAPGGAVKTAEVTLPGFRHDLYAMNLSLFAGSPFFAAHKDRLVKAGLEFVGAERSFATAFPDGTWCGVERDLDATAGRIAALDAGDAQRWRDMVAAFGRDAPHIFALLGFADAVARRGARGVQRLARRRHAISSRGWRGSSSPRRATGSTRIFRATSSR